MTVSNRVRWLAGGLVALGFLEILYALLAGLGMQMEGVRPVELEERGMGFVVDLMVAGFAVLGVLRIVAGVLTWNLRARWFGIAALILGLGSTCSYCCPLAWIALGLGLVVYLNQDVARAFRRRASGVSFDDAVLDRGDADEIAAVFDVEDAVDGDAERRELDQDVATALIAILPDDWDEAVLELSRDPGDARLTVVLHDGTGEREVRPDAHLLDVLGALDEYVQASGGFLQSARLRLRDDGGWRYEWTD